MTIKYLVIFIKRKNPHQLLYKFYLKKLYIIKNKKLNFTYMFNFIIIKYAYILLKLIIYLIRIFIKSISYYRLKHFEL